MKEVNGKIWIENVDNDIKNISQLDPKIYKIAIKLMQLGANIEIGPGIIPEDGMHYPNLNGLYCTNLTMDQIVQLLNSKDKEEQSHERQQTESEVMSMDISRSEEIGDSSEKTVDDIFSSIYRISQNYHLGKSQLLLGVPIGGELDRLVANYNNDVIPKINELSIDDKKKLLIKLQEKLNNYEQGIDRNMFTYAINHINASLNLTQEENALRKK